MARCGCSGTGCSCLVIGTGGITVTGTGTTADPYRIGGGSGAISQALKVQSTPSLALRMIGEGTTTDPFILTGTAQASLSTLADVRDSAPEPGDVPVWVASPSGHWEFQPPPTTDPGAISVSPGLVGDGSGAAPLALNVSGTWGEGLLNLPVADTEGGPLYVDSDGVVRTSPVGLARKGSSTAMPTNLAGLVVFQQDTGALVYGDGTAWRSAGAEVDPATLAAAIQDYLANNPDALDDAEIEALVRDTGSLTRGAIEDVVALTAPSGGGGGSFDTAASYTVSGQWTFTLPPAVPNGSFATSKITNFSSEVTALANAAVAARVGAAPAALDTLDELAAAMGDDPNLRANLLAAIGEKVATTTFNTHTADTAAHGATSSATASTIVRRDASGGTTLSALALTGTNPTAGQAVRRDWVENAIANATGTGTVPYLRVFQNADGSWPLTERPDAESIDAVRVTATGVDPIWLDDDRDFVLAPR